MGRYDASQETSSVVSHVRILVTLSVAQQNNEQGRTYEPKDWMIVIGGHPITLGRRKLHSPLAMTGRGTRLSSTVTVKSERLLSRCTGRKRITQLSSFTFANSVVIFVLVPQPYQSLHTLFFGWNLGHPYHVG